MLVNRLVKIIIHQWHQVSYTSFLGYLQAGESDDMGSIDDSYEIVSRLGKAILARRIANIDIHQRPSSWLYQYLFRAGEAHDPVCSIRVS